MERRKCPECGFEIIGRTDKIFCSDQCRNKHNNRANHHHSNYVKKINHRLLKNRRILEKFILINQAKVTHQTLLDEGFNFDYYTNTQQLASGNTCYYCYEFGYFDVGSDFFELVEKRNKTNE